MSPHPRDPVGDLRRIAFLLERSLASSYKVKAFRGAATAIAVLPEGRDPASVGLEVWLSAGIGNEDDWRREVGFWKTAGVTHAAVHTTFGGYHHKRIAGKSFDDHLKAITRYRAAVADLL